MQVTKGRETQTSSVIPTRTPTLSPNILSFSYTFAWGTPLSSAWAVPQFPSVRVQIVTRLHLHPSSLLSVRGCQLLVLWLHFLLRQEGQRGSFPFPELLWGGAHLYPGGGAWTGGCAVAARAGRKLEREEQRGEAGWRAPRKPPGGQRVRASGREGARQRACDEERRGEESRAARGGHSGRRSRALLLERLGAAARRPRC